MASSPLVPRTVPGPLPVTETASMWSQVTELGADSVQPALVVLRAGLEDIGARRVEVDGVAGRGTDRVATVDQDLDAGLRRHVKRVVSTESEQDVVLNSQSLHGNLTIESDRRADCRRTRNGERVRPGRAAVGQLIETGLSIDRERVTKVFIGNQQQMPRSAAGLANSTCPAAVETAEDVRVNWSSRAVPSIVSRFAATVGLLPCTSRR